jgi:hypothetical protein
MNTLETPAHAHPYAADGYFLIPNEVGYDHWHRHQPPPSTTLAAAHPVPTPYRVFPVTAADARVAVRCLGCDGPRDPSCLVCETCFWDSCPKHPVPLQRYKRSFDDWKSELTAKK